MCPTRLTRKDEQHLLPPQRQSSSVLLSCFFFSDKGKACRGKHSITYLPPDRHPPLEGSDCATPSQKRNALRREATGSPPKTCGIAGSSRGPGPSRPGNLVPRRGAARPPSWPLASKKGASCKSRVHKTAPPLPVHRHGALRLSRGPCGGETTVGARGSELGLRLLSTKRHWNRELECFFFWKAGIRSGANCHHVGAGLCVGELTGHRDGRISFATIHPDRLSSVRSLCVGSASMMAEKIRSLRCYLLTVANRLQCEASHSTEAHQSTYRPPHPDKYQTVPGCWVLESSRTKSSIVYCVVQAVHLGTLNIVCSSTNFGVSLQEYGSLRKQIVCQFQ